MRIAPNVRKAVETYSAYCLKELRLQDWIVYLHDDPPERDSLSATIRTQRTTRHAVLRLGDLFFNDEDVPDNLRTVVLIHEHVHLHFEPYDHMVNDLMRDFVPKVPGEALWDALEQHLEYGVDQLAWAFAARMHPFKLPKGKVAQRR